MNNSIAINYGDVHQTNTSYITTDTQQLNQLITSQARIIELLEQALKK